MQKRRYRQHTQSAVTFSPSRDTEAESRFEAGLDKLSSLWVLRSVVEAGGLERLLQSGSFKERLAALGVELPRAAQPLVDRVEDAPSDYLHDAIDRRARAKGSLRRGDWASLRPSSPDLNSAASLAPAPSQKARAERR